ncbi:MAG: histidine phosphatase family protein [Deltaproteobacteria bacterium]|nr:histidine phosphatase family protein [Deltaproteobacteria bacterium]
MPVALGRDPELVAPALTFAELRNTASREFVRILTAVTRMWARGELDHVLDGVETWGEFRERVAGGIRTMTAGAAKGARVAAFTSGGAVSVAAGFALGIGDERVIELSWLVRNTSITELAFSTRRVTLAAFNSTPHLVDPATVTVR